MIDRLATKRNRADYTARTEKDGARIVGKFKDDDSVKGMSERGREIRKLQHVSVSMILFRENRRD